MSIGFDVDLNPYTTWLRLEGGKRPAHAYQFLALQPLESDMLKIQAAAMRQRALLDSHRANAAPELWQQISDALEAAISSLIIPERKSLLDARLKRQLNAQQKPHNSGSEVSQSGSIQCHCGAENSAGRKFCRGCGASLFGQCVKCRAEVAADEQFCGSCGTNIKDASRAQSEQFQQQIADARASMQALQFAEAAATLRPLALLDAPGMDQYAATALELLDQISIEQENWIKRIEDLQQRARHHLQQHAYQEAFEVLSGIPLHLCRQQVRSLIDEVNRIRAELRRIPVDIKEALSTGRKLAVFPLLDRLLSLKPDHAQARQLAEKLRNDVFQIARKKLVEHEYRAVRELLEQLPRFVRNSQVEGLLDKARELESLAGAIEQSLEADEIIESLATRLVKIAPSNSRVAERLASIKQQRMSRSNVSPVATRKRTPTRTHSQFGIPIERLESPVQCETAPQAEAVLDRFPGEFFVAFGLALQAIQKCRVSLNLLPATRTSAGLLSSFSLTRRKSTPRGGWGIDVGSTGIRAIRLLPVANQGPVQIDTAIFIPFGDAGQSTESTVESTRALRVLAEQFPFSKAREQRDVVVSALSGGRTLGRFFDLPPSSAKKLPELIEFEARHQIPIPLTELCWASEVLEETPGPQVDQNGRHLLLVAARDFLVRHQVALFEAAQVPLDELTAGPVALHNAILHELADQTNYVVSSIDIGARGFDVVVSSPYRVWFRTCAMGGKAFTDALVKQLQLTQTLAEEVKRAPHQARRFYQFEEAIAPLLVQTHSELTRSFDAYAGQFPGRHIEKLYLLGGGAKLPGLLSYLVQEHRT